MRGSSVGARRFRNDSMAGGDSSCSTTSESAGTPGLQSESHRIASEPSDSLTAAQTSARAACDSSICRQSGHSSKWRSKSVCSQSLNCCRKNNSIRPGSQRVGLLLIFGNLFLQAIDDAATGGIDTADVLSQFARDIVAIASLDGRHPECVP